MAETKPVNHKDEPPKHPPAKGADDTPSGTPTKLQLIQNALAIQDDVSYYVFRDGATATYPGFEMVFDSLCTWVWGYPRPRVHNLGVPNKWGYPAGPECNQGTNLGALPPNLTEGQINALNTRTKNADGKCVPTLEAVVALGEAAKKAEPPPPAKA